MRAAACRADGAPVPASTGMWSGTASRTPSSSSTRSSAVRAGASPVEPLTSTARMPRLDEVGGVGGGGPDVDLAVLVEQRHEGHADPGEDAVPCPDVP